MIDFALSFRCLQKATEALFELSQASLAAGIAWQSRLNEEFVNTIYATTTPPVPDPVDPFSLWQSWVDCWMNPSASPRPNQVADVWQSWAAPATTAIVAGASAWPSLTANAFMNATPWSFYQGPLMAMMLSYGVPYSVAAPTARASTCAMDAADAACAQWRSIFNDENSLGDFAQRRRRLTYLH
ncbi:MAG TPA: hypothetical protein VHC71_13595 [Hyphomicrobium sp.]|nr:hypothetical protein [Hyphomicrobium sp.]